MKILINETMFDSSIFHQKWYNGETYGGKVVEVDDKYSDCERADFDGFVFNVDKYNARKQKENNKVRIIELDNWFKTDYATYEQMLVRRSYLNLDDEIVDNFRNKTYHDLFELYTEAEVVAGEIRELREK